MGQRNTLWCRGGASPSYEHSEGLRDPIGLTCDHWQRCCPGNCTKGEPQWLLDSVKVHNYYLTTAIASSEEDSQSQGESLLVCSLLPTVPLSEAQHFNQGQAHTPTIGPCRRLNHSRYGVAHDAKEPPVDCEAGEDDKSL